MGRVSCRYLQERGVPSAVSLPKGTRLKTTPKPHPKSKDGRMSAICCVILIEYQLGWNHGSLPLVPAYAVTRGFLYVRLI